VLNHIVTSLLAFMECCAILGCSKCLMLILMFVDTQKALVRESAERNSKASRAKIEQDEQRLAMAEANMKKMLERVNQESRNVEEAIQDLKRAQEESDGGFGGQLSSLRKGGLIKQATLVGALLFTMRSGIDTIGFVGGDPSHAFPALLQGALAIVFIVGFMVL